MDDGTFVDGLAEDQSDATGFKPVTNFPSPGARLSRWQCFSGTERRPPA